MLKIQDRAAGMRGSAVSGKAANAGFCILLFMFLSALVFALIKNHLPDWDESVYIGMGKYIYSLGATGGWEMLRPLGIPLLIGALWKAGLSPIIGTKLIAIAFSAACLLLVYILGKNMFSPLAGLFAALALAATPAFFYNSAYGISDIPSAVFALIALYTLVKGRSNFIAGMFAGIAFLFRFPQGLFFAALLLAILIAGFKKPKLAKSIFMCCAGFLIIILPFLAFNYFMYGNEVSPMVAILRPMLLASGEQANPSYAQIVYPIDLVKSSPLLILSVAGLVYFIRKKDYSIPKVLMLAATALFMIYFSAIENKQMRFALAFLPYVALFCGCGFSELVKNRKPMAYAALILSIAISLPVAYLGLAESGIFNSPDYSVEEFYSYFNANPANGAVLATMPHPMAYSDIRLVPMYYPSRIPLKEIEPKISAVMLVPSALYCRQEDEECGSRLESFITDVTNNGERAFSKEYYGKSFEIYSLNPLN
ncbi:MAG TPA: hypothetical protein HA362_08115 [Nanoarchaeota archaeon]|nr:hypothetical protein [Nanoarchaeota archaeon]